MSASLLLLCTSCLLQNYVLGNAPYCLPSFLSHYYMSHSWRVDIAIIFQEFETIYFGHMPVLVGNLLTNMALCHRKMGNAEMAESLYLR